MNESAMHWKRRAEAAERTVAVLKAKVRSLYDVGANTALHRQLARTRARAEQAARKRAQLARVNELLEAKVTERTRALRRVLDHVAFGFVVVGPDLRVQPGFSEASHSLFGSTVQAGQRLSDLLRLVGDACLALELGFEQVFDDVLPEAVTLAQLPRRFMVGGRALHLTGRAIRVEGAVAAVLLTIQDGTALEVAQADSRRHATLVSILHQRAAFEGFLADARETLERATGCDEPEAVRRAVHTIKGNAASFDLDEVVAVCHAVEGGPHVGPAELALISGALRDFLHAHHAVLRIDFAHVDGQRPVVVEPAAYTRLQRMASQPGMPALRAWLAEVALHPVGALLGPLPNFAERLGERLGKPVVFHLRGADVRVDQRALQPVLHALPHLVHNAVDHGIEPGWARGDKPAAGQLRLAISEHPGEWRLTMRDDGRGIATERLVRRAVESGLLTAARAAALSQAERVELAFVDGLSSAERTTEVSGRGVGLAAVRAAVESVGGVVRIESSPGRGTTLAVVIPKPLDLVEPVAEMGESACASY